MNLPLEDYLKLKRNFKHRDGFHDYIRIGGHEIFLFNFNDIVDKGGYAHQNMVCFLGENLIWVSNFPQGSKPLSDSDPVTGIGIMANTPNRIEAIDWNGSRFEVDIITGNFTFLNWTK